MDYKKCMKENIRPELPENTELRQEDGSCSLTATIPEKESGGAETGRYDDIDDEIRFCGEMADRESAEADSDGISSEEMVKHRIYARHYRQIEEFLNRLRKETTGWWYYVDDGGSDLYDTYSCSRCHRYITVDSESKDDIGFVIEDIRYCPHCGSRNTVYGS